MYLEKLSSIKGIKFLLENWKDYPIQSSKIEPDIYVQPDKCSNPKKRCDVRGNYKEGKCYANLLHIPKGLSECLVHIDDVGYFVCMWRTIRNKKIPGAHTVNFADENALEDMALAFITIEQALEKMNGRPKQALVHLYLEKAHKVWICQELNVSLTQLEKLLHKGRSRLFKVVNHPQQKNKVTRSEGNKT